MPKNKPESLTIVVDDETGEPIQGAFEMEATRDELLEYIGILEGTVTTLSALLRDSDKVEIN